MRRPGSATAARAGRRPRSAAGPAGAAAAHRYAHARGFWFAPIWSAPFRPFFLAASLYAPVLALASAYAYLGGGALWRDGASALWHGHEMMFGFAGAVIAGLMLTALPSWAGIPEVRGGRLGALLAAWLLGRAAYLAVVFLPPGTVPWGVLAAADIALFAGLSLVLTPQLLRAPNRWFLAALPLLYALLAAGLAFHAVLALGERTLAQSALVAAVHVVMVLYAVVGGVLTPLFTDAVIRSVDRGDLRLLKPWREVTAVALVAAYAAADLLQPGSALAGGLALVAAAFHGWRMLLWRGWRTAGAPLVWAMHLGYLWLVAYLAMRGLAELAAPIPRGAMLHAFTVGALGMMMMGLMSRVALRHTGRPQVAGRAMTVAFAMMATAPLLRLGASAGDTSGLLMGLSMLAWAAPFAIYAARFGPALLAPSRPRMPVQERARPS